ncbi:lysyl oxidase family protein [Nocardioides donggukensis]|uniref:lysyl oxidase family protein n=1 Tax=Nocardioides donggukensis TaxID=2774019 RepID=UPI00191E29A0|nr:lysyl oxidase family protein [Nocardioides donggukensis]
MIRRILAPAVALCATAAVAVVGPLGAQAALSEEPAVSPLRLVAPKTVYGSTYRGRVYFDAELGLIAQGEPFELWSKRPAWTEKIRTEWRTEAGTVALPEGTMSNFRGLPKFLKLVVRDESGATVRRTRQTVCLNSWASERVRPDAPLRSPYPRFCPYRKWTLGSVQGIQEGHQNRLELGGSFRLARGTYEVTAVIREQWRDLFGIAKSDAQKVFTLEAGRGGFREPNHREAARRGAGEQGPQDPSPTPADREPTTAKAGEPAAVKPDLRSLPAFGIRVSPKGNHLRFSATVWNAGDSPLVVDGFRREDEDVMDAYQYFIDADGNQTGYQQVGTMEWDTKDTHFHWHFKDFARYRLLDADMVSVVRSRKEAFCLANTDATDYTVPGADWRPDGTDLETACGRKDSISIREVLSSGSGDTYSQFRAGQAFKLKGLPNGTYYIAVEANPKHRLVEHSTDNNVELRQVEIGGVDGARTVSVERIRMP